MRTYYNPETIRDYLQRAQMDHAQAEALSRVFEEMATRGDIARLEDRFRSLEERIDLRFRAFEEQIEAQLARRDADLTWKMIAIRSTNDIRRISVAEYRRNWTPSRGLHESAADRTGSASEKAPQRPVSCISFPGPSNTAVSRRSSGRTW